MCVPKPTPCFLQSAVVLARRSLELVRSVRQENQALMRPFAAPLYFLTNSSPAASPSSVPSFILAGRGRPVVWMSVTDRLMFARTPASVTAWTALCML